MDSEFISSYRFAKEVVMEKGYREEILWQERLDFEHLDETTFLREIAWVILSSGMREKVIRGLFPAISDCFYNWESSRRIVRNQRTCLRKALRIFNNRAKISALVSAARMIDQSGFQEMKDNVSRDPSGTLTKFDFIGPVTFFHLAKNIGLQVAKPDRHLVRISRNGGYDDVQEFCRQISIATGDSIPVVDIVLWRFATIEPCYLNLFFDNMIETYSGQDWGSA
jgi:hypothetical protein